ncbi:Protein kinase domain - like 10 [Theobroma cacao]|nr:Protein kinase domain - like 10 [Theobroma cacao]
MGERLRLVSYDVRKTAIVYIYTSRQAEALALLKWKASIQNQNQSVLPSWNISTATAPNTSTHLKTKTNPCAWFGIHCRNADTIMRINLTGYGVKEMGNITNLFEVHMDTNHLTGPIPSTFGNLKKLSVLYIFHNHLSGSIPSELGYMKSLTEICLYQNNLSGLIPTSLGDLRLLTRLQLYDNQLSGPIPEEIGNLKALVYLELSQNQLNGSIPASFGNLGNLETLFLRDNKLSGSIPQEIGNLMKLTMLELDHNQLTGNLPQNICRGGTLRYFTANDNHLVGPIPEGLKNCTSLLRVYLEGNRLTGNISEDFGVYPSLKFIDLSDNEFYGEVSSNWGLCKSLQAISIARNNITGRIPPEIGSSSQVHRLDLSSNDIVGEIPMEIAKLTSLTVLCLNGNQLSGGEIPVEFHSLQSLSVLNLSYNNLSGEIPASFELLHGLSSVDIAYNELQGPIPNNQAFQNASIEALRGNKGLCGNVSGLPPCTPFSRKGQNHKTLFTALFPLLSLAGLSISSVALFSIFKKRKKNADEERQISVSDETFFSISSFNGKVLYEEIIRATKDFDAQYCVGKGGNGNVYKAELSSGDTVAVKKFHPLHSGEMADQKQFLNEVRALIEIRHRNIVKFYGFCSFGKHSFLVYKYLERGSLASVLRNDEEAKKLDWDKRVNIVKGVVNALSYLHHDCSPPIVHRDITSSNVLLDSDFGVLALEVMMGAYPGDFLSNLSLLSAEVHLPLNNVLDQRLSPPLPEVENKLVSIMKVAFSCLDNNPESRPTMYTVSQLFADRI